MQVDVIFRGIDPSPALEAFARTWVARLALVHASLARCEVRIEVPHRHHRRGRHFHVAIAMTVPGRELVVTRDPGDDGAHDDAYVAVRDAFRAARRRLDEHARSTREDRRVGAAAAI